jgi:hypothetical protein
MASCCVRPRFPRHAWYFAFSETLALAGIEFGASPLTACLCSAYNSNRSRFCKRIGVRFQRYPSKTRMSVTTHGGSIFGSPRLHKCCLISKGGGCGGIRTIFSTTIGAHICHWTTRTVEGAQRRCQVVIVTREASRRTATCQSNESILFRRSQVRFVVNFFAFRSIRESKMRYRLLLAK